MNTQDDSKEKAAELRRQAEERLQDKDDPLSEVMGKESHDEQQETVSETSKQEQYPAHLFPIIKILQELKVHQIELEMQNEELRRAQIELDAARARYFALYDLAPVGYCTVSEKGIILEANLTIAKMLDVVRGALVKKPLSSFIVSEDQDIYYLHRKSLFETGAPQSCELRLLTSKKTVVWARLSAIMAQESDDVPACWLVLSDITECRCAQSEKAKLQLQLQQAQKMEKP